MPRRVPLVDLKKQYDTIKEDIDRAIKSVLASGNFVNGHQVTTFEESFAAYCSTGYGISVNSGTDALLLALKSLGIGSGDEVITSPHTFAATVEAILHCGARPVFVDIDPETYNIDPLNIERVVTKATKAIVPVHLYGQPVAMEPVREVANKYDLRVVEDACQSHGAEYLGEKVGSLGDAAAFSFYPGKNLGAYGDGGIVVTNSVIVSEYIAACRNHGSKKKNFHDYVGYNSRLDEIQAAVLSVKLGYLDEWNNKRRKNAERYNRYLADLQSRGLVWLPREKRHCLHVYHLYVIRVSEQVRDGLLFFLRTHSIGAQVHYPVPVHLHGAYRLLGYECGDFPVAERVSKQVLSLPMWPELTEDDILYVVQVIEQFFRTQLNLSALPSLS